MDGPNRWLSWGDPAMTMVCAMDRNRLGSTDNQRSTGLKTLILEVFALHADDGVFGILTGLAVVIFVKFATRFVKCPDYFPGFQRERQRTGQ